MTLGDGHACALCMNKLLNASQSHNVSITHQLHQHVGMSQM